MHIFHIKWFENLESRRLSDARTQSMNALKLELLELQKHPKIVLNDRLALMFHYSNSESLDFAFIIFQLQIFTLILFEEATIKKWWNHMSKLTKNLL